MLRFKVSDGVKIAHGNKVFEAGKSYEAEDNFVAGWVNAGLASLEAKKQAAKSSAKKTTKR